jgi:tetraacyldisaccharide-1-P 4'-kinase
MPLDALLGARIVGLAGIGRPLGFFKALERIYGPLEGYLALRDHEPYTEKMVLRLIGFSEGKRLVCTMKDAIKLLAFQDLIPERRMVALIESVSLEPLDTLKELLFGEVL